MQIVGAMSGGGRFVDSASQSAEGRRSGGREEGAPAGQHIQESGLIQHYSREG